MTLKEKKNDCLHEKIMCVYWRKSSNPLEAQKWADPGSTRNCNLRIRSPTPYPLGHRADMWWSVHVPRHSLVSTVHVIMEDSRSQEALYTTRLPSQFLSLLDNQLDWEIPSLIHATRPGAKVQNVRNDFFDPDKAALNIEQIDLYIAMLKQKSPGLVGLISIAGYSPAVLLLRLRNSAAPLTHVLIAQQVFAREFAADMKPLHKNTFKITAN